MAHQRNKQGRAKDELFDAPHRDSRKEGQSLLRDSDLLLQIYDSIPDSVTFSTLADGRYLQVNRAFELLTGYSADEVIGRTALELGLWVNPQERLSVVSLLHNNRAASDVGCTFRTKSGEVRKGLVTAKRITLLGEDCILAVTRDITQDSMLRQTLRESESRFRALFDDSPVALFEEDFSEVKKYLESLRASEVKDFAAYFTTHPEEVRKCAELVKVLNVNKAAVRMHEALQKETLLAGLPSFFAAGSYTQFHKELIAILQGSTEFENETETYTLQGQIRNTFFRFSAAPGQEDTLKRVYVSIIDITDRKRMEEELRRSRDLHRQIIESVREGIVVGDRELRCTTWNPFMESLTGVAANKLLGKTPPEAFAILREHGQVLLPAELEGEIYASLKSALAGERVSLRDLPFVRPPTGELQWVSRDFSPLRDNHGEIIGVIETLRDTTDRHQAEAGLRKSETMYRSLIRDAVYGIYRSTEEGRFLEVNPALVEMLGYASEAELLAVDMAKDIYVNPGDRARLVSQLRNQDKFERVEIQWKRKDGKPILIQLSGRPVRVDSRGATHFEVFAEDVTERMLLEEQFRQAQKMEAIGRLAGGIAHDFNNMIVGIMGYTELLMEQLDSNDPRRSQAANILRVAERAASLTQQLLVFSRRHTPVPKVFDINPLVGDTQKLVHRVIGEDIELVTLLDPGLAHVRADPVQFEQVLMNLAVNARDAMPRGGKLTIETKNVELREAHVTQYGSIPAGCYVLLVVSDTGTGMDPGTQAHIFEPFFTTKAVGRGTGLGLPTVYGIVTQGGGHIAVESKLGSGTTFKVYLPRVDDSEGETKAVVDAEEPAGGSETVLLVEDDSDVREATHRHLLRLGYKVLVARTPAEALQFGKTRKGPIHLLLTDIVMPSMDGRELAAALTRMQPQMKVLYMSGYDKPSALRGEIPIMDKPFLPKPFTRSQLARKVRLALGDRQAE